MPHIYTYRCDLGLEWLRTKVTEVGGQGWSSEDQSGGTKVGNKELDWTVDLKRKASLTYIKIIQSILIFREISKSESWTENPGSESKLFRCALIVLVQGKYYSLTYKNKANYLWRKFPHVGPQKLLQTELSFFKVFTWEVTMDEK